MKAKKSRGKTKSAGKKSTGKRAAKDLTARRGQGVHGGRSDLQAKLQFQLNEANKITDPAPKLVHETTHQT